MNFWAKNHDEVAVHAVVWPGVVPGTRSGKKKKKRKKERGGGRMSSGRTRTRPPSPSPWLSYGVPGLSSGELVGLAVGLTAGKLVRLTVELTVGEIWGSTVVIRFSGPGFQPLGSRLDRVLSSPCFKNISPLCGRTSNGRMCAKVASCR